ncbi:MAG: 2'-5' RNA ligase family protein [Catenulispora sp.]|nr:2'-5' RNA ligase family protein [Catenulispora sp.]
MGGAPDPLEATFAAVNPFLPRAQGPEAGAHSRGQNTATIGVAVPIPEPFGSELQKWRESFHDPMARAIPTHVTLLPPSEVDRDALPAVEDHLAAVAAAGRSFPMVLQGTDTFRPISPVTFVRVAVGGAECAATEARVRSGVLAREARFPYHPHVTVAHELPEDVLSRAQEILAGYEARFLVTGFALYLHGDDGVWRVRRYFPYGL